MARFKSGSKSRQIGLDAHPRPKEQEGGKIIELSSIRRDGVRSNIFVDSFIRGRKELLDELYFVGNEIAQEKMGWMQSGATKEIVGRLAVVLAPYMNITQRELDELVRMERDGLYGQMINSRNTSRASNLIDSGLLKQFPVGLRKELSAIEGLEEEHMKRYEESLMHLTKPLRDMTLELTDKWIDFLSSGYQHMQDFYHFLILEEFADLRQENKHLLQALERGMREGQVRNTSFIDSLKAQILSNAVAGQNESFEKFIDYLNERTQLKGGNGNRARNMLDWLRLISPDLDSGEITKRISSSGVFPDDLRTAYSAFVGETLASQLDVIKRQMLEYREDSAVPTFSLEIKTTHKNRRRDGTFDIQSEIIPKSESVEVGPKQFYKLILSGDVDGTSEEKIRRMIEKTARKFASHDPRMLADIQAIVESLIEDPYGLGVAKLIASSITSPYSMRKVPLWRYRADQRQNVVLQSEESRRLRAIYYFDRRLNPNFVILDEILHHEEFDKKYTVR